VAWRRGVNSAGGVASAASWRKQAAAGMANSKQLVAPATCRHALPYQYIIIIAISYRTARGIITANSRQSAEKCYQRRAA